MQIQPMQLVEVTIKCAPVQAVCQMIHLTERELRVSGTEYFEKGSTVSFSAKFFRGEATISQITFEQACFTYTLDIHFIQYQPGLLVDTTL